LFAEYIKQYFTLTKCFTYLTQYQLFLKVTWFGRRRSKTVFHFSGFYVH